MMSCEGAASQVFVVVRKAFDSAFEYRNPGESGGQWTFDPENFVKGIQPKHLPKLMHKYRFYLIFAIGWGVGCTLLAWLFGSEDSPIYSPDPQILNAVMLVHIVPSILSYLVDALFGSIGPCGPNGSDAIYWVFVLAQWLVVGFGIAGFIWVWRNSRASGK